LPLPLGGHHFADQPLIRLWQPVVRGASGGGARLGWISSALLVYWVLQTRTLRLRLFNGVASALLVIFNAAIAVWPMVALNVRSPRSTFSLSCGCYMAGTTHEPSRWSRSLQTRPTWSTSSTSSTLTFSTSTWILGRRCSSHRSRLLHPHSSGDGGPGAGQKRR
jgi:hypothetical protein